MNDLRPFSKNRSEGGKGNIHRLSILNRKKKKGRETMGTMTEIKENVEECGNTSGLAVCLSPRRRVTEEIHWLCYHGKVISSSFFGLRWIYLFIFGCAGSPWGMGFSLVAVLGA